MCSALRIINVVAESEDVFPKLICKLKRSLHLDPLCLSFYINRLVESFYIMVQIADKTDDPLRFMKLDFFRFLFSFILKTDGKLGI